jgi:epoxyqueuosine reductase QueG
VADQYGRGTRSSYALANWVREQGYAAQAHAGPGADALSLIPPAIAAGLGELGKHGSLINSQFGSGEQSSSLMKLFRSQLLYGG